MRIDNPISDNAIITGSFTGSFKGDGSQLTGITAEWDGSHTGDASITGDLTVGNLITAGVVDGVDVSELKSNFDIDSAKLAGIEAGATADQSGAEIKTAYEAEADTNAFTDAEKSKLAALEAGATGDQTGAEIKALYEGEADTNAFTDAASAKLAGIEAGATGDQTAAEIKIAYESNANTNAFDDAAVSKLAGLEAGAEVNVVTSVASKTGDVSLVKGDVGLGSVDNTSDANKPISTATQTALDLKAPLASPVFSGTVTIPTPISSDNSTKAASTAYVNAKIQEVVSTAPAALDTLNELAAAIGDDANFAGTVTTALGQKLVKASNLSDLTNVGTARTNLGLGTAATTNSTAYATAAQGTKADTAHGWGDHSLVGYLTSYTDTNTTYSAGTGLGLSGTTFSHSDTSTQASVNNSGRTYIQDITLDGFGHVTGIASATETVVNTDTNTTYTAGNGLSLSGTTFLMSGAYTGNFSATGNITAYSDERLKKDVKTIEGALAKTNSLRGVEFTRIADDAKSIGVIAQELEAVLPELVLTDDEGMKSVNYAQITGLLIEAVKELSAKVDELSK